MSIFNNPLSLLFLMKLLFLVSLFSLRLNFFLLRCNNTVHKIFIMPLANLRGAEGHAPVSSGSKFFQFHAVLGKNLAKSYVGAPSLQEILDPPLFASHVAAIPIMFNFLSERQDRRLL